MQSFAKAFRWCRARRKRNREKGDYHARTYITFRTGCMTFTGGDFTTIYHLVFRCVPRRVFSCRPVHRTVFFRYPSVKRLMHTRRACIHIYINLIIRFAKTLFHAVRTLVVTGQELPSSLYSYYQQFTVRRIDAIERCTAFGSKTQIFGQHYDFLRISIRPSIIYLVISRITVRIRLPILRVCACPVLFYFFALLEDEASGWVRRTEDEHLVSAYYT